MEKKVILRNVAVSLLLQVLTIISGVVVPKVIIMAFGSDVNGLISSITQFLSYITLLEGGLSGVVTASLYKPLQENDVQKISGIINATERFFRQLSLIYLVYVMAVAVIYPLFVETQFSYGYVLALVCALGIGMFIQYFFSLTYRLLLNADRKVYIVSAAQALFVLVNMLLTVVLVNAFRDVLMVKLIGALVFVLQPIIYHFYVKKHFSLDKKVKPDIQALKQRWDGFGQNIAYFIHNNTDIVIITLFAGLTTVSVYSVHLLIVNALKSVFIAIASAIAPSLGKVIAQGDVEKSNKAFDLYEFAITALTTLMFACGIALITPFIGVYTADITDANYFQPVFAMLLMIAEMIYCFRDPYITVAYISGHFRQTAKFAYLEAAINIVLSLVLVWHFGLVGVAIGTLTAMAVRMFAQVWYVKRNILYSPVRIFGKKFIVFAALTASVVLLSRFWMPPTMSSYLVWAGYAVSVFVPCAVLLLIVSAVCFKSELTLLLKKKF